MTNKDKLIDDFFNQEGDNLKKAHHKILQKPSKYEYDKNKLRGSCKIHDQQRNK